MGLFEHLDRPRYRLTRAVLALLVGTVIGVFFTDRVLMLLQEPFCESPAVRNCVLSILDPTGNTLIYFKVALMLGGILSIPVVTYQLIMLILPGLTRQEQRFVRLSIPATTALFVVGVVFAWNNLMSLIRLLDPELTVDGYIGFVTTLLFWIGVAFQTPLIFVILHVTMRRIISRAVPQEKSKRKAHAPDMA